MIDFPVHVKCPYCGHENRVWVEQHTITKREFLEYCDIETGGCDRQMVIRVSLTPVVDAFSINYPAERTPVDIGDGCKVDPLLLAAILPDEDTTEVTQ